MKAHGAIILGFLSLVTSAFGQNPDMSRNGIWVIDGNTYPKTGAGIAAAINAALAAGGGEVDARDACNATFSSELDIGNQAGTPLTLLLPTGNCSWTSSVRDGVSSGFRMFRNSRVIGENSSAGSLFKFVGGHGFNGSQVVDINGANSASCLLRGAAATVFSEASKLI